MSPAATDTCTTPLNSLDDFRKLVTAVEVNGQQLNRTPRSVFKAPEISRFELLQPIPAGATVPADVRKLLGWSEEQATTAGAYPVKR
jgi:hypothetical protein